MGCTQVESKKPMRASQTVTVTQKAESANPIKSKGANPSAKREEPKPIEKKKEPTVGMSESEIENTKLGKATSIEECRDFFEDICAETELRAIEQRFDVARMLSKGKIYSDIMSTTSASTATISRVSRVFNGGTGMLEKTLIRLEESEVNAESES